MEERANKAATAVSAVTTAFGLYSTAVMAASSCENILGDSTLTLGEKISQLSMTGLMIAPMLKASGKELLALTGIQETYDTLRQVNLVYHLVVRMLVDGYLHG